MNIGTQIKALRQHHKLSVQELADKTGLTKDSIYKIEAGRSRPLLHSLEKIAEVLNKQVEIKLK